MRLLGSSRLFLALVSSRLPLFQPCQSSMPQLILNGGQQLGKFKSRTPNERCKSGQIFHSIDKDVTGKSQGLQAGSMVGKRGRSIGSVSLCPQMEMRPERRAVDTNSCRATATRWWVPTVDTVRGLRLRSSFRRFFKHRRPCDQRPTRS